MTALKITFIFVPILVAILLILNLLLAPHRPDSEKTTAYECGYSPIFGQTRTPFSIQYYLVGILFLVFDLEVLLLYPLAVTLYNVSIYGFIIATIFFVVLTLGFVYEISVGALYFTDQRSAINKRTIQSPKFNQRKGVRIIHTSAVNINKKDAKSKVNNYSSIRYFKIIQEKDNKQETDNIYLIAKRIIREKTLVTSDILNLLAPRCDSYGLVF